MILRPLHQQFCCLPLLYETVRLTSAVTALSSADPVRVFQDFSTPEIADMFFPSTQAGMNKPGKERGWAHYDLTSLDAVRCMLEIHILLLKRLYTSVKM